MDKATRMGRRFRRPTHSAVARIGRSVGIGLVALASLIASCGGDADEAGGDGGATPASLQSDGQDSAYGSGNVSAAGLNLVPPPVQRTEATAKLDDFGARMVADGRCTTVRRHYSAVVATGVGIGCLRSSDLLTESGILAVDPAVLLTTRDHLDAFAVLADRKAGSVELYGDYVVLLIENLDGTFSIAVDTIASAADNQSINDVLLSGGNFAS